MQILKGGIAGIQNRSGVTRSWEKFDHKGAAGRTLGSEGILLHLGCGGSYLTLCICQSSWNCTPKIVIYDMHIRNEILKDAIAYMWPVATILRVQLWPTTETDLVYMVCASAVR